MYSLIQSGENSAFAHFAKAIANHHNSAFSFHQVPSPPGGQRQHDMRGLPDTYTHGRQCVSSTQDCSSEFLSREMPQQSSLTELHAHSHNYRCSSLILLYYFAHIPFCYFTPSVLLYFHHVKAMS